MGRKANPLILDYFERGAKIGDSSNRYEHTCKRCGEFFPKGRMENLTAHLTKKCAVMTMKERVQIIMRLNDLVVEDAEMHIFPNAPVREGDNQLASRSNDPPRLAPNLPAQQNGLEVLAEASRQLVSHPNLDEQHDYLDQEQGISHSQLPSHHELNILSANPNPLDPQYGTTGLNGHLSQDFGLLSKDNGFPTTVGGEDPSVHSFMPVHVSEEAFHGIAVTGPDMLAYDSFTGPHSAAMQHISTADLNNFGLTVPFANPPATQPGMVGESNNAQTYVGESNNEQPHVGEASSDSSIFMDPHSQSSQFITETGTNTPQRPKIRRKFGPERRKEVLEVRKVGACMRCRMLRKVCSLGDPCQTCATIENPRLWKNTCIRKKLLDVFAGYSAMPYAVHLLEEQKELKGAHGISEKSLAKVEAHHFVEEKLVFKSRHCKPKRARNGSVVESPDLPFGEEGVVVIDLEVQDLLSKVQRYLQAITPVVIAREKSPSIRATLEFAHRLNMEQLGDITTGEHDILLPRVIELWAATFLMTEHNLKAHFAIIADETEERTGINEDLNPYVYATMDKQFRAAIEKRTAQICKTILPIFEQRALVRDKGNPFETFLVAFILLNCVERMCWLFNCWENFPPFQWPFETSPAAYAQTGEEFATTIQMLISLRSLQPKLTVDLVNGFIVPQTTEDSRFELWLENAKFAPDLGAQAIDWRLSVNDCRCMDGTLSGRLLEI